MTKEQWKVFCDFKDAFKSEVEKWKSMAPELKDLQQKAARQAKTPDYPFETTVVYNRSLEEVTQQDEIKLIIIGDNPGKDEQLAINNRYLVGQAGKIAEGYFRRNPELGIDFRKNVIILNKTPVHSAKTAQLKTIAKLGDEKIKGLLQESQSWMAKQTAALHSALGTELWLVGYSELKDKGLFCLYRDTLKACCGSEAWKRVYLFQHFSMNRFSIDLAAYIKNHKKEKTPLETNIHELGALHKNEIFAL